MVPVCAMSSDAEPPRDSDRPESGSLPSKRQKLVRCGSSIAELLAGTQEVSSAVCDGESYEAKLERALSLKGDSVTVEPWRRIVDVKGYKTEVYGVNHANQPNQTGGQPALRIVIVPGNPGQGAYYLPLMSHLHVAMQGKADILSLSHLGHGIGQECAGAHDLTEQIQHKIDFIKQLCLEDVPGGWRSTPGGTPVVLIGHSIGAHIVFHAAKVLEAAPVDGSDTAAPRIAKVIGMFPFLGVDSRGSKQSFLRKVVSMPSVIGALGSAVGAIPLTLRQNVIKFFGGGHLQELAIDSTSEGMKFWNCYNACYMASSEFSDLDGPIDWSVIERLKERAAMLTCPNDIWAPDWQMQEMREKLPTLQVIHDESLVHGFCVDDKMSKTTADHLAGLLQDSVAEAEAGFQMGHDGRVL